MTQNPYQSPKSDSRQKFASSKGGGVARPADEAGELIGVALS
jgi:hypothetical protein